MRIFFPLLALLPLLPAQDLRRGLTAADAVVVGRAVGSKPHDADVTLHTLQVLLDVRGAQGATAVTVLDWPKLALHQRPSLRQSRLYCLQDASATATRLGLPTSCAPYFKMVAFAGSNPLVGADTAADPVVRFAQVLAAAEAGTPPNDTTQALFTTAAQGAVAVRTEATRLLTERGDLRARLGAVQWSQLVARAAGEIEDVPYKIALAELCAEQRLDGLFDALVVGLGEVADAEYARTVGRIGRMLHGEDAAARLLERLRQSGQKATRDTLLLTLGATNTTAALDALLRMDRKDAAVEAALREHRAPQAREAVGTKK